MVEHRYLGLGDKTKLYLSDSDVRRLHEQRRVTQQNGLALLEHQFGRDPVPAHSRRQAHLYLLAEPIAGQPGMLLDLVHGPGAPQRLLDLARHADAPGVQQALRAIGGGGFNPSLAWASDFALRSAGAALTYGLNSDRSLSPAHGTSAEDAVELEVDEDGALRIFMSRLRDSPPSADPEGGDQRLLPIAVVSYARQFVALTAAAAEHAGYFGNWILAAGATGITGLPVHDYLLRGHAGPRYHAPDYQRASIASYAELVRQPAAVTERLVGRLLRSLGVYEIYARALTDPSVPDQQLV